MVDSYLKCRIKFFFWYPSEVGLFDIFHESIQRMQPPIHSSLVCSSVTLPVPVWPSCDKKPVNSWTWQKTSSCQYALHHVLSSTHPWDTPPAPLHLAEQNDSILWMIWGNKKDYDPEPDSVQKTRQLNKTPKRRHCLEKSLWICPPSDADLHSPTTRLWTEMVCRIKNNRSKDNHHIEDKNHMFVKPSQIILWLFYRVVLYIDRFNRLADKRNGVLRAVLRDHNIVSPALDCGISSEYSLWNMSIWIVGRLSYPYDVCQHFFILLSITSLLGLTYDEAIELWRLLSTVHRYICTAKR